jgi:hypothetical protein
MIFYFIGVGIFFVGMMTLIWYPTWKLKHSEVDVYEVELSELRKRLKQYDTLFLDPLNQPVGKFGMSHSIDPSLYREGLATKASPTDIIAYSQQHLYSKWSYGLRMQWDQFLFAQLEVLLPVVKGEVQDYVLGNGSMTNTEITKANETLSNPLLEFTEHNLYSLADLTNTYTLVSATANMEAYKQKVGNY